MWFIYIIATSFFNALWTALTKNKDKDLSPTQFTAIFRFYTVIFLIPIFFIEFKAEFFTLNLFYYAFLYALVEGLRTVFIVKGSEKDYYSTYAFVNTSPIFTVLFVPLAVDEKISMMLIAGTIIIITGGFLFYKIGKFSWWGLMVALISGAGGIVAKKGVEASSGISFSVVSFTLLVFKFYIFDMCINKKDIFYKMLNKSKTIFYPALFSAIGTWFYFKALETGPISKIAPLQRLNLIFGFFMSYFLLKEKSNWKIKFAGGIFILIGGILVYIG